MTPVLPTARVVRVFLAFAFAYFLSALIRAITATLSPTLTLELGLQASDLGLLAGGFFFGFALTQLPLGTWLDRHGPRTVIACFLGVAVLGCVAFSMATSFSGLLAARVLCGAGLSACLMAPLTGYRRWFSATVQMRTNAWMLMTGSLGMLASTLPVQWLLPVWGWRTLFAVLALAVAASIVWIWLEVPTWALADPGPAPAPTTDAGYAEVWRNAYFRRLAPMGFFNYGGMIAMQTLWAGPWMVKVGGYSALQAATGLFWINVAMLCTFWTWGMLGPWLARRGLHANRLMAWGMPSSLLTIAILIEANFDMEYAETALLAVFCMTSSSVTLSQPALALAFPPALAGRALSAFNLVIFAGVFAVQWGIGLAIDALRAHGLGEIEAYQGAFALFGLCCALAYLWFLWRGRAGITPGVQSP
jgi:MFS family permease